MGAAKDIDRLPRWQRECYPFHKYEHPFRPKSHRASFLANEALEGGVVMVRAGRKTSIVDWGVRMNTSW